MFFVGWGSTPVLCNHLCRLSVFIFVCCINGMSRWLDAAKEAEDMAQKFSDDPTLSKDLNEIAQVWHDVDEILQE